MEILGATLLVCITVLVMYYYTREFAEKWMKNYFDTRKEEFEISEKNLRYRLSDELSFRKYQESVHNDVISKLISKFADDFIKVKKLENTSIADHLKTLDQLIEIEFRNYVILPRVGMKDKPLVDDVKETTSAIGERIMKNLQPEFFDIFQTHGLSEEYIMTYITRELFAKIIFFERDARKKDND